MSKEKSFIAIDGDDIGDLVVEFIYKDNVEEAKKVSEQIKKANADIISKIKGMGGEIVFDGGDNILAIVNISEPDKLEALGQEFINIYKDNTGHTATVGIADNQVDAQKSLVLGKNSGKNRVVQWDNKLDPYWEEVLEYLDKLKENKLELNIEADFWRTGLDSEKRYSEEMRRHLKENVFHKHGIDIDAEDEGASPRRLNRVKVDDYSQLKPMQYINFIGNKSQIYRVLFNNVPKLKVPEDPKSPGEKTIGSIIIQTAGAGEGSRREVSYPQLKVEGVELVTNFRVEDGKVLKLEILGKGDWVGGKNNRKFNTGQIVDVRGEKGNKTYQIKWIYPTDISLTKYGPADPMKVVEDVAEERRLTWEKEDNLFKVSPAAEASKEPAERVIPDPRKELLRFADIYKKIWNSGGTKENKRDQLITLHKEVLDRLKLYKDNQTPIARDWVHYFEPSLRHTITNWVKVIPEGVPLTEKQKKEEEELNLGIGASLKKYAWMFSRNAHIQKFMYDNDIEFLTEASDVSDKQKEYAVMELEAYLEEHKKCIEAMTHEEIVDFINKLPVGGEYA